MVTEKKIWTDCDRINVNDCILFIVQLDLTKTGIKKNQYELYNGYCYIFFPTNYIFRLDIITKKIGWKKIQIWSINGQITNFVIYKQTNKQTTEQNGQVLGKIWQNLSSAKNFSYQHEINRPTL